MPIQITSNIKMLYYDKIGLSQGIDINKTSESIVNEIMLSIEKKNKSKGYNIFHYCYFLNESFIFQPNVCNYTMI